MNQIKVDSMKAMKSGDKVRLNTLRSISAAVSKAETSGKQRKELDDEGVISVLRKEIKTRRESAEIYRNANEAERAEKEDTEAGILSEYVPVQLSEDDTRTVIAEIISSENLSSAGARGIGAVMKEIKSRSDIDPGIASKIARDLLNS